MSATQTTNLGLNKPDRQDYVSVVSDINQNMDRIDSSVGNIITPVFSPSTAYSVGDYVIYNRELYRFTTAHPAGSWNSSHVVKTNFAQESNSLKSAITSAEETIVKNVFVPTNVESTFTFSVGDVNSGTGAKVTTNYAAITGYKMITDVYFGMSTDEYYYRIAYTKTNSTSAGNVVHVTDYVKGTTKMNLRYPGAGYYKVVAVKDLTGTVSMADYLSDVQSKCRYYKAELVQVDDTLENSGKAADAKVTGIKIKGLMGLEYAYNVENETTFGVSIGSFNTETGQNNNSDSDYARTGYTAIGESVAYALKTNDYYYRITYFQQNSQADGNGVYTTDWITGTTKTILTKAIAPYFKVLFVTDPSDPSTMTTDICADILSKERIYELIQIDDTLSVSGKAADAKTTGDRISQIEGEIGEKKNLFYVDKAKLSPWEIANSFVTLEDDGTIMLNGDPGESMVIPIMGTDIISGTVAEADTNLAADTYTGKIIYLSDGSDHNNDFSLRYAEVGDNIKTGSTRWLNNANREVTVTVSDEICVVLYVTGAVAFDHFRFKIQIEKGESVGDEYTYGLLNQADYIEIKRIQALEENYNPTDEKRQDRLAGELKGKVAQLNKEHGRMLNIAYITDTHVFPETTPKIFTCSNNIELFMKVLEFCDFGVHGGDATESGNMELYGAGDYYESHDEFIKNSTILYRRLAQGNKPVYVCRGNHDCNHYLNTHVSPNTETPTAEAVYKAEFSMLNSGLVRGNVVKDPADPYGNYYYVDYDEFKVRIIVLTPFITDGSSFFSYGETQKQWLVNQAFDFTNKSDWSALIFEHTGNAGLSGEGIVNVRSSVSAFIRNSGIPVIGWIHGHAHEDNYGDTMSGDTYSAKINVIGVDQSFLKKDHPGATGGDGTIGEDSEYCVDVFSIDTVNHMMYQTRAGRLIDAESYGRIFPMIMYHFGAGADQAYRILPESEEA